MKVGSRFSTLRGRARLLWQRTKPPAVESDQDERVYYDTCLFAIELEHAAIDYLQDVVDQHDGRQGAAQLLLEEHRMVLNSLWNRINQMCIRDSLLDTRNRQQGFLRMAAPPVLLQVLP